MPCSLASRSAASTARGTISASARMVTSRPGRTILALPYVLSKGEEARKLRLVILDACRDNPFLARMEQTAGVRTLGRGLGRIEPERGILVAYAARDGQLAQDGDKGHSPFTRALLDHIDEPGLEIGLLFRKVRDTVLKRTGSAQEPYVYGSLPSEGLFFRAAAR